MCAFTVLVCRCVTPQTGETRMVGKTGEKREGGGGGAAAGGEQIKSPRGNTTVAEKETERNGVEGRKAGLTASSKYW